MTVYEQYKKLKLDTSWIGLEKGPARGGYFCTPIGRFKVKRFVFPIKEGDHF